MTSGTESTAAVLGLGSMGFGMARSLLAAGFRVTGFDVNPAAIDRLVAEGGGKATSPKEAAEDASVVASVVVNAAQTEAVLFGDNGCASALKPGAVFVSCATMAPAAARDLAARVEATGAYYLDAPISGGAVRAAEGALTVLASGKPAAFDAAAKFLDAVSEKLFKLGDEAGLGAAYKMVNQLLAGVHIAAASEAMAFAAAQGLDLETVYDIITKSAGNSWMFENRMPHVLDNDYTPRSAVSIFVKDLGIIEDMARAQNLPVPVAATALQMFLMTAAAGMARDDDASVARLYAKLMQTELKGRKG